MIFSGFFAEIKAQFISFNRLVRTREFWIYMAVIFVLMLIAMAAMHLAAGFDPLTRGQLGMRLSCKTGEGQLATIIIGIFVFAIAAIFTLGEVVNWVEESRLLRMPGRRQYKVSYWRPLLHLLGTVALGVGGYFTLLAWCT